jgi:biotin-dependent carboxylase-like uncharacterized protein
MDMFSHRLANIIVGNEADAATLEVTMAGPELAFDDNRRIAVTGALFDVSVDGRAVDVASSVDVRADSTLKFGRRLRGSRAYVAVSGGVATPAVLGSRATHVPSGMGGFEGRALKAGDRIPLGPPPRTHGTPRRALAASSGRAWALPEGRATLRVLPGPQLDRFEPAALDLLQSSEYRLGADSNRMGYRLIGPRLPLANRADVISDATPLGALQVPASGQPILLMADRQTTGGYPKIAAVISADISTAGQLGPGDSISFVTCSPREALKALIAQERSLLAAASHE